MGAGYWANPLVRLQIVSWNGENRLHQFIGRAGHYFSKYLALDPCHIQAEWPLAGSPTGPQNGPIGEERGASATALRGTRLRSTRAVWKQLLLAWKVVWCLILLSPSDESEIWDLVHVRVESTVQLVTTVYFESIRVESWYCPNQIDSSK